MFCGSFKVKCPLRGDKQHDSDLSETNIHQHFITLLHVIKCLKNVFNIFAKCKLFYSTALYVKLDIKAYPI